MKTHFMKLDQILNVQKWQTLQDALAVSTKMSIITVDYKGVPLTEHSQPRSFCKTIREMPMLEDYCRKCDSRGGLEAARLNKPYIYLCHFNIVDIAIPIIIADKYIGAIMAGQVKLFPSIDNHALEQISTSPHPNFFQDPILQQLYDDIPGTTYEDITVSSQMLYELSQYIVGEATKRNLLLEIEEQLTPSGYVADHMIHEGYSLDAINHLQNKLSNVVTNAQVDSATNKNPICKNPVLNPVFEYIHQNKGENISQKKAADLCHISTGHLSRLFVKETGETFSRFIARQKVEWAKQLLENTELSITRISDDMGFGDPGYFIKTFKKYETVTPALYRKYFRKSSSNGE